MSGYLDCKELYSLIQKIYSTLIVKYTNEIYKHKDKLLKCSKLTESEFYLYFNAIIERINFIPSDFISLESRQKAYDLCKDVDIKDTPFVALSIYLAIPLWIGDKKLKEGLKQKGFSDFYVQ